MIAESNWKYPPPRRGIAGSWDRVVGPGATPAEQRLSLVPAIAFAAFVVIHASVRKFGWSPWQYLVAAWLAADIVGGIATNATSAAKRWYHRSGRSLQSHIRFVLGHLVYIFLVAWLFALNKFRFFALHSSYLILSALIVLKVRPYLQRSVALLLLSGGILVSLYAVASPPGLEWFPPFLYLKLIVSYLLKEEPYSGRPREA